MDGGKSAATWPGLRALLVEAIRSGRLSSREVMEELGVSSGRLAGWCRAEGRGRGRGRGRAGVASDPSPWAAVTLVGGRSAAPGGTESGELISPTNPGE